MTTRAAKRWSQHAGHAPALHAASGLRRRTRAAKGLAQSRQSKLWKEKPLLFPPPFHTVSEREWRWQHAYPSTYEI